MIYQKTKVKSIMDQVLKLVTRDKVFGIPTNNYSEEHGIELLVPVQNMSHYENLHGRLETWLYNSNKQEYV